MFACEKYFTVGLLGTFPPNAKFCNQIDAIAASFHDTGTGLRIRMGLLAVQHLAIAKRILQLKRIFGDLRLEVFVTEKQWHTYKNEGTGRNVEACNFIIETADTCEVIPNGKSFDEQLQGTIVSDSDELWYGTEKEKRKLEDKILDVEHKPQLILYNPSDVSEPPSVISSMLLMESLELIRRKGLFFVSDHIPDHLLNAWQAPPDMAYEPYLKEIDNVVGLLRMMDCEGRFLPLKVFAYTYSLHNSMWAYGRAQYYDTKLRFEQFQTLVRRVAAARKAGKTVAFLEIFAFDRYDKEIEQTKWVEQIGIQA